MHFRQPIKRSATGSSSAGGKTIRTKRGWFRPQHADIATCVLAIACCLWISSAALLSADEFTPPGGYYSPAAGLTGDALRQELQDIIDGNRDLGYDAARTALRVLDADPEQDGNILLIYSGNSIPGHLFISQWNREHVWPQSYGADKDTMPGADLHHLYPANPAVNSARGNKIFDYTDGSGFTTISEAPGSSFDSNSWEPRDQDKGRIARAMLYMDLRYDGSDSADFVLAETASQSSTQFAKLSVLLEWHRLFPPDEYERRRNHLIHSGFSFGSFTFNQGNRNPFVDIPDLADAIFSPPSTLGWGKWRWIHFSVDQLFSGLGIADLDDPDNDNIVNLIEYSANLNPNFADSESIIRVASFGSLGTQIRYDRQKAWARSGLLYEIQRSATPLREETWQSLSVADISSSFTTDQGETELVTLTLPSAPSKVWYRMKVAREVEASVYVEAFYDPVLVQNAAIDNSIFVYDSFIRNSDFKSSTWMDLVIDEHYPWVYHQQHGWLYFDAERDDRVWFWDPAIGWMYTHSGIYPFLFSASLEAWTYYHRDSARPVRFFHLSDQGWVLEQDLLQ